jgi:hypothetical protein
VPTELSGAENVLERDAFGAALYQVAQGGAFFFAERTLELKVEVDAPFFAKDMGKEILGIQSRALHALLVEV